MNISTKNINKWTIVFLSGQFDSHYSIDIGIYLKSLIEQEKYFIALDLSDVSIITSAGLRVLLETLKIIKSKYGNLELINPHPNVRAVFDLAGFSNIFSIIESHSALE